MCQCHPASLCVCTDPVINLHNQVVYLLLTVLIHLYACIGVFTIIIITNNFLGVSINVWTV